MKGLKGCVGKSGVWTGVTGLRAKEIRVDALTGPAGNDCESSSHTTGPVGSNVLGPWLFLFLIHTVNKYYVLCTVL